MGNHASVEADEDTDGLVGQQRCDEMLTRAALRSLANIPHLKETSFELIPSGQRQQFVSVRFKLSADTPCRVSSFIIATEDRATGAISCQSSAGITPPLRTKSPKRPRGPPPVRRSTASPASKYHTVCIPHLATSLLTAPIHTTQPHCTLIIRVESLSPRPPPSAPPLDLRTMTLGCHLPPGTNAHTVFATFRPGFDGLLDLVVLHRRMWLDGRCIDLPFVADPRSSMTQRAHSSSPHPAQLLANLAAARPPANPRKVPRVGASPTRAPHTPRQVLRSKSATYPNDNADVPDDAAPAQRAFSEPTPRPTGAAATATSTATAATTTPSLAAATATASTVDVEAPTHPPSEAPSHLPSDPPAATAMAAAAAPAASAAATTIPAPAPTTASAGDAEAPPSTSAPQTPAAAHHTGEAAAPEAAVTDAIHTLSAHGRSVTLPEGARVKQLSSGGLALHFTSPPPTLNSDLSHQVALILGVANKQATITTTKTTHTRTPSGGHPHPTAAGAAPPQDTPDTPTTAAAPPTPPTTSHASHGSALTTTTTTASTSSTLIAAVPSPHQAAADTYLPPPPALPHPHALKSLPTKPLTPPTTPPRSVPSTPSYPATPPDASPTPTPSRSATPSPAPAASAICQLCNERPIGVLTLPCYHCCMCSTCGTNQQKRHAPCPICGQALLHLLPISSVLAKTLSRSQCITCLPNICGTKGSCTKPTTKRAASFWGGVHGPHGPTKSSLKKHPQPHPPQAQPHPQPRPGSHARPHPPAASAPFSLLHTAPAAAHTSRLPPAAGEAGQRGVPGAARDAAQQGAAEGQGAEAGVDQMPTTPEPTPRRQAMDPAHTATHQTGERPDPLVLRGSWYTS